MLSEIRIFLLDDNVVFITELQKYLQEFLTEHISSAFQLCSFLNVEAMLQAAEATPPDLLIADIDLQSEKSGISGAGSLHTFAPDCSIIYLTAYLEFAPDIFETDPLYFVLKDQYHEKLPAALQKFSFCYQKKNRKLRLSSGGKQITVAQEDILYCEHIGKNVHVFCRNGQYSVRSSLPDFQKGLPEEQFVLCHKSSLVNMSHVHILTGSEVIMDNGTHLTISRSYRDAFRLAHNHWLSGLL